MLLYLDFVNISIRINLDIPLEILGSLPGHYNTYWFIKFGNNYGPDVVSGLLSETSSVPSSGLLNQKGLDTVSTEEMRGPRQYTLNNDGGSFNYAFPMAIQGLFNFTFYVSTSETTLMMAPVSLIIDSNQIYSATNSRLIDVFRKYQRGKTDAKSIMRQSVSKSDMLYYIDLKDNIIKSSSNKYTGFYAPMSTNLSLTPSSEAIHTSDNVVFDDPITEISLSINRYVYQRAISEPNPGKPYIQNYGFSRLPILGRIIKPYIPFEYKPLQSEPIRSSPYENFTDMLANDDIKLSNPLYKSPNDIQQLGYQFQPEYIINPILDASSYLTPHYDNDPKIDARINNEFTNNDSLYIPYPTVEDNFQAQLADQIITAPSNYSSNYTPSKSLQLNTTNSNHNSSNMSSDIVIIIVIIILLAIVIVAVIIIVKRHNKDKGLYQVGYSKGDNFTNF